MLVIESREQRDWPYGVNVNGGQVILDFDAERLLSNVDILIPRDRWASAESWTRPSAVRPGDIALPPGVVANHEVDWPFRIVAGLRFSWFLLKLVEWDSVERGVQLSPTCVALLNERFLVGLYGELPQPQP
jgi:hypothetical protein